MAPAWNAGLGGTGGVPGLRDGTGTGVEPGDLAGAGELLAADGPTWLADVRLGAGRAAGWVPQPAAIMLAVVKAATMAATRP